MAIHVTQPSKIAGESLIILLMFLFNACVFASFGALFWSGQENCSKEGDYTS